MKTHTIGAGIANTLWPRRVRQVILITAGAAIALMAACVAQANAAAVIYTDQTGFQSDAAFETIPLDVEGFNVGGLSGTTLEFGDITVESLTAFNISTTTSAFGVTPTEGTHFIFGQAVTFTFLTPINAFGIDLSDFGDAGSCDLGGGVAILALSAFRLTVVPRPRCSIRSRAASATATSYSPGP